ncbi:MAG: PAS domain-containing sensor histidine kinase [Firmicutes bacterium HGW-Firmicutes-1]|nr:MAG: PAS domain-containing sensor histidine kinase [Firmicutes bacterium HGW-Firmicutes-1]
MQKKLLGTYLLIITVTMLVTVIFSWNKTKDYFFERVQKESETRINLLLDIVTSDQSYDPSRYQDFVNIYSEKTGSRITIVDSEGQVIAESDNKVDEMDNHKNREEIAKALEKGELYSSLRYSNTMKVYFQYVAIPLNVQDFQGVLRTATPLTEIEEIISDMLMMVVIGIFIGALLAIAIAYFLTRKIMLPINELTEAAIKISEGDYEDKIYIQQHDEIGQLADAFNNMTFKLRMNLWKLENKNAELESILSSMSSGIIAVNHEMKIGIYNDNFLKLFHIEDQDIKGKLFYEVTRNLVIFDLLEKSLELSELIVKEAKIYDSSGERNYLIYANPIRSRSETKKSLGVLLVVSDVTQMRKLENMRSDFVSNVTHELKTPLTSIRGFVDTLKNGAIDEEEVATRFLDIIDIEAERLEGLIDDILILSEIEAMVGDKNIGLYNIGEIINEVVELLLPEAKEKNLQIETFTDDLVVPYKCNKNRIKQLLINVIGNAIKYTDVGFVKIRLREEFKFVIIEIEDSGIGIEKKHIPRLFERFYRVDRGRSRATGGTGLGLSIVKHIVELYNGKIKVDSKVGEGTKMTIRLPY